MARPFTREQALQNAAFLRALTATGNARGAARTVGMSAAAMHHRRAHHPSFAQRWDAASASAHARLHAAGGKRGPSALFPARGKGGSPAREKGSRAGALRTQGGEPVAVRTRSGKLQLRPAHPDKLTIAAEQAFLSALSASANLRLSAAAAGASVAAFYRRKRQNKAFAREMRLALERGYERLEMALHESWAEDAYEHDGWRHNEPPAMPPMSANQALQLMYLHQKEARLQAEPPHIKRRRGESREAHSFRLSAMYEARLERDREAFRIAQAARAEKDRAGGADSPHEPRRLRSRIWRR